MTGQEEMFRRRINQAVDDAREARPHCDLTFAAVTDNDGFCVVAFSCKTHGATWRDIIGQIEGTVCPRDTGSGLVHSRARGAANRVSTPTWEDTEAPNPNVPKKGV